MFTYAIGALIVAVYGALDEKPAVFGLFFVISCGLAVYAILT